MFLLTRLSIKQKLLLIVTPPFLITLYFISYHSIALQSQVTELEQHRKLALINEQASLLVHELQLESSYAAGLLNGDGFTFSEELSIQIDHSQQALSAWQSTLKSLNIQQASATKLIEQLGPMLEQLTAFRLEVSELTMEAEQAINFYHSLNTKLLAFSRLIFQQSNIPELANSASLLYYLQMNKERAALERSILTATFLPDHFTDSLRQRFIGYLSDQQTLVELTQHYVNNKAHSNIIESSIQASKEKELNRVRERALSRKHSFKESAPKWISTGTAYQLQLKEQIMQAQSLLQNQLNTHLDSAKTTLWKTLLISLGAILAASITIRLIIRSINSRLAHLAQTMKQVEQDNNLTLREPINENDEIAAIANAFNLMQDKLAQLVQQVLTSAAALNDTLETSRQVSSQVSKHSQTGQKQVLQAVKSMSEIAQSVQHVAANCAQASTMSGQCSAEVKQGKSVINQADLAMQALDTQLGIANTTTQQLAKGSEQVSSVLDVIKSVAEQTNLLALNAAIEAARAGEHGRGFAVVADEVRNLASQTQSNTEQIQQVIDTLQKDSHLSLDNMLLSQQQAQATLSKFSETLSLLSNIQHSTDEVNQLNSQNATTTEQQSTSVKEVHQGFSTLQQNYQTGADDMEQLLSINLEQADLMKKLVQHVSVFKLSSIKN